MNKIADKFFKASFGDETGEFYDSDLKTEKGRKQFELLSLGIISSNKESIMSIEKDIETLTGIFDKKMDEIQYKINRAVEKVRGAILAERGTSGAIYTTQIPINKQQITENTTTRIEGGIAFGVPQGEETVSSNLSLLQLKNLEFSNLYINSLNKFSSDNLEDFTIEPKTQTNMPIEFKINLNGVIRTTSSLVLELKNHGVVEVYRNGQLYTEKSLVKNIVVPIDINTLSVAIRSYPSVSKTSSLVFKRIGYTELIYDKATYFETKNITVNKDFSQIVIDTCDNSNDSNININYQISINDEPYEGFSPVVKHKALEKQSIITVNKSQILNMIESKGVKYSDGDYRFLVPNNLQTNLVYKHNIFLRNYKRVSDNELNLVIQNDTLLDRRAILSNMSHSLYINGTEILEDTFMIYKGVVKLVSIFGGVPQNINLDYLETLLGVDNIYINQITKELLTDDKGEKYISLSYPEFQNSFEKTGSVFFPGIKPKKQINTIKIKAELKSLDKRTVPFISRILIRGM